MKRGAWHQCGDSSQTIARELLEMGAGVGVIISPRDLLFPKAIEYAEHFHGLGAEVLIDPQFYVPDYTNTKLASYPTAPHRTSVSELQKIGDADLSNLAAELQAMNAGVAANAVITPALAYQSSSPGIAELNARLFGAAKAASDAMGLPTYASVVLGRSAVASMPAINEAISHATALDADGWYFAFEFEAERIPTSRQEVYRCCDAGLTLACTGKPVLHAFAGPMALLSLAFGATGAAIGHRQNLWRFNPGRWQVSTEQGGSGAAPPRFFSSTLWGTIVHPDETARLSAAIRGAVITPSPFLGGATIPPQDWPRLAASKHFVFTVCEIVAGLAASTDARQIAHMAKERLQSGAAIYEQIVNDGVFMRDAPNAYHVNWCSALDDLLTHNNDDFDFLDLL
jgi:hypothetical protein